MIALSDQQLQDFTDAVNWEIGERLPDGRVLGSPEKRNVLFQGAPYSVALVEDRFHSKNKTILELGAGEGIHTAHLAKVCKQITAVEVRPKNVVCALVRLCLHDVSNAKVVVKDVRDLDEKLGHFDILYHFGLLYHLDNPVEHFYQVSKMADDLLLNTCYCTDQTTFQRSDIDYNGKCYKAFVYQEYGWGDVWSGVDPISRWLHKDSLIGLLHDLGYGAVEIVSDYIDKSHNRMTVVAKRSG